MRMGTYSVLITGGRLVDPGLALGFLRHPRKVPKLERLGLLELVQPGFRHWCLRVCSLFGLILMVGNALKPLRLPCMPFFTLFMYLPHSLIIYYVNVCDVFIISLVTVLQRAGLKNSSTMKYSYHNSEMKRIFISNHLSGLFTI